MKKHRSLFAKAKAGIAAHKILTAVIVLTLVVGGYEIARAKASAASSVPEYTLSAAHMGTLQQTVSGTGQVSASNQTDIQSQVSGTIESIDVSVGQAVTKGQLIATIDPTNALTALENARLSLAKLNEPAKATDLSNAQNSLTKSYGDAFNSASSAYIDLPNIMTGLHDLLYDPTGFLADQHRTLSTTARDYRDQAANAYDLAAEQYALSLQEFKGLSRSSATSSLDQLYSDTYKTIKMAADAANKSQTAVAFIIASQPDYDAKDAASANTSVNGWASQANSDTSSILSAQNSIVSAANSLGNLTAAPDSYDLQSAQSSLAQAQRTYEEYFIRAPYDGIIGRIPVNVYGQANGTIATIVGAQKIASISLNEVDAAKVAVGQSVNISFDAIDGLEATGTVSEVDQIGTVSSGVVSYGVKIAISTQDPRIKPGMSVSTTIITKQDDSALLVPSSAVKTQGGRSYVQVVSMSGAASTTRRLVNRNFASSTASTSGAYGAFASSTRAFGSGTGSFGSPRAGMTLTVSASSVTPQTVYVTVGDSDDTNTAILSGLNPGQLVVTRTSTGSTASSASAPSLLQSLGGNRAGAAGANRTGAAAGGNRTFGGGGAVRIGG